MDRRADQPFLDVGLRIGQQHRQGRARQPLAFRQHIIRRYPLERPVEPLLHLHPRDEALILRQPVARVPFREGQRLRLTKIVGQHQRRDALGHFGQQLVALLHRQIAV